MISSRQQKQLAGILPQRPSLYDVQLEATDFPPHLHPHEIAHATPGANSRMGKDADWNHYFQKSGEAHHHGHSAHELTKMIKSGELGKDKGHHENAHAMHQQALHAHKIAGDAAEKAGAPWMKTVHSGHAAGHEKAMVHHKKKLGKY